MTKTANRLLPIVVGTNPERKPWLNDCLASIRRTSKYRRVLIHATGGYEIAALRTGIAKFNQFLYLHDSCEILSPDFWDIIDTTPPTWLFGGPPMYLGVYNRQDLEPALTDAPATMTKETSIHWECELPRRIHYPILWPEVTDATGRIEERHGRTNLVLENTYLRKLKGTWR